MVTTAGRPEHGSHLHQMGQDPEITTMPGSDRGLQMVDDVASGSLLPEAAIERIVAGDRSFLTNGAIVRFYYGYFQRDPDTQGYLYWSELVRGGLPRSAVAEVFATSAEFRETYGDLSDGGFVDLVYANVLDREPDAAGRAYWLGVLEGGHPRSAIMAIFTESGEHRTVTRPRVERTVLHLGMLRRAPTASWLDGKVDVPFRNVARTILRSEAYAERFADN